MQGRVDQAPDGRFVITQGQSPAQEARDAVRESLKADVAKASAELRRAMATGDQDAVDEARERLFELSMQARVMDGGGPAPAIAAPEAPTRVDVDPGNGTRGLTITTDDGERVIISDMPPNMYTVSMAFIVCLSAAIVISSLARLAGVIIGRRQPKPARLDPHVESQLTRVEQSIDAMAIEVERLAEGQRFQAKLLTERDKVGGVR